MRVRIVSGLVLALALIGCSASDVSNDSSPDATQQSTESLTLTASSSTLLAGSLSNGDHGITFEISRKGEQYYSDFRDADGNLLLHTSIADGVESLKIGEDVSLVGPSGSLFSGTQPNFGALTITGDLARAGELSTTAEFELIRGLPEALMAREDVDLSILPNLDGFETPPAVAQGSPGPGSQLLSHDPAGCAACHTACAVMTAACVAATWGVFAWLCAGPGVACHVACAGGPCQ